MAFDFLFASLNCVSRRVEIGCWRPVSWSMFLQLIWYWCKCSETSLAAFDGCWWILRLGMTRILFCLKQLSKPLFETNSH
jgi:hypothetical protein